MGCSLDLTFRLACARRLVCAVFVLTMLLGGLFLWGLQRDFRVVGDHIIRLQGQARLEANARRFRDPHASVVYAAPPRATGQTDKTRKRKLGKRTVKILQVVSRKSRATSSQGEGRVFSLSLWSLSPRQSTTTKRLQPTAAKADDESSWRSNRTSKGMGIKKGQSRKVSGELGGRKGWFGSTKRDVMLIR